MVRIYRGDGTDFLFSKPDFRLTQYYYNNYCYSSSSCRVLIYIMIDIILCTEHIGMTVRVYYVSVAYSLEV